MVMAPPEQRECVPPSSGVDPSMASPTLMIFARSTTMIYEALTERSWWWDSGQSLTGVAPGHPCPRMWGNMFTPAQTEQAVAD